MVFDYKIWDMGVSTDDTLLGYGRAEERRIILRQIEKTYENSDGDLTWLMFSLKDVVAHLAVSNPSRILTIEKVG